MNEYEFTIRDSAGLWGSMKIDEDDPAKAAQSIIETLNKEEIEPEGSLLPDFTLELVATRPLE
jgi:hypothetical protein